MSEAGNLSSTATIRSQECSCDVVARFLSTRQRGSAASRRDAHQCFAEIAAFQHADEGGWRILKAVGDVLAIADAAIGDSGADGAQERRVVLGGEFVVDVAAQR